MRNNIYRNLVLLVIAVVIVALPLVFIRDSRFNGADDKASEIIAENSPGYKPWFRSFWAPPGDETASMLFALQAAVGAGIAGWVIGYYMGKRADGKQHLHNR
jgi:cobalt/nickel transport protein